ncbi:hypothetical protein [Paenibacillus periandrae]|uniref:hypothetical protein n=1 Tax=Paenibacillus periandrae TaxID=1761741 RepID=UPI001F0921D9|nr:hypothetical protein [Paenibacillus periandrae]
MYDFISICSDAMYSKKIRTEVLEEYLVSMLKFTKESNLIFSMESGGEIVRITGIPANSQGNYAFNSLEGVEEVNLIEIAVPWKINDDSEKVISDIAKAITKEYAWIIDEG